MKSVAVLGLAAFVVALLAFGAAAPPVAHAGLNDAQEPGSVLVFPYFRSSTILGGDPRTEIEISVTCPRGTTCLEGASNTGEAVRLKAMWVCPPTTTNPGCGKTSFSLETTVNGTLFFNPSPAIPPTGPPVDLGNVVPPPPSPTCGRGFLIVWVIDASGRPIKYDGLIGNAVVRESSQSALAYNAVGIQAGLLLPVRAPTDRHFGPGGFNGKLDFNGIEYMPVTGKIFGTVKFPELSDQTQFPVDETFLIFLTLDVVAGQLNEPTSVGLDFFTADETPTSDSHEFVCWTRVRLTDINPGLTAAVMGRKGLVESTAAVQAGRAVTLMGLVETVDFAAAPNVASARSYSLNTGGRPVPTTFAP